MAEYFQGRQEDATFPGDRGDWLECLPAEAPSGEEEYSTFRQDLVRGALAQFRKLGKPGFRYLTVRCAEENTLGPFPSWP